MRLALDQPYSTLVAISLRGTGHDVVAAVEQEWQTLGEKELLDRCVEQARSLLTNDVADFAAIARRWASEGRHHFGLIFTADSSWPRSRDNIGRFVAALDSLLEANPAPRAFSDRIHWL
ncbi:MAG: DUF5615 family PIN-like protein [Mycobacteriales bacterium]